MDHEPHACLRAWERFGLELDSFDLSKIADLVSSGKSLCQKRQSDGMERHIVFYKKTVLPILIEPCSGTIITVLPDFRIGTAR